MNTLTCFRTEQAAQAHSILWLVSSWNHPACSDSYGTQSTTPTCPKNIATIASQNNKRRKVSRSITDLEHHLCRLYKIGKFRNEKWKSSSCNVPIDRNQSSAITTSRRVWKHWCVCPRTPFLGQLGWTRKQLRGWMKPLYYQYCKRKGDLVRPLN